jgi:hypothetical protein
MSPSDKPARAPTWLSVFGAPLLIGVASLAGLLAALLFGETGRYLSWFAVGSPILAVAWLLARRQSS